MSKILSKCFEININSNRWYYLRVIFFFFIGLFGWLFSNVFDTFSCSVSYIFGILFILNFWIFLWDQLVMQDWRVLDRKESRALWKGEILSVALVSTLLLLCPHPSCFLCTVSFPSAWMPLTLHFPFPYLLIFISYFCFWHLPLSLSPHLFSLYLFSLLFQLCFLLLSQISLSFFLLTFKTPSSMLLDSRFLNFKLLPIQAIRSALSGSSLWSRF